MKKRNAGAGRQYGAKKRPSSAHSVESPPSSTEPLQSSTLSQEADREYRVSTLQLLFRFADPFTKAEICLAMILSVLNGFIIPLRNNLIGRFTNLFSEYSAIPTDLRKNKIDEFNSTLHSYLIFVLVLGFGGWAIASLQSYLWMASSNRQIKRIRAEYFRALLRQDFSWKDQNNLSGWGNKLGEEMFKIQDGLSEKVGVVIKNITLFSIGLTMALYSGWILAIVILVVFPFPVMVLHYMWKQQGVNYSRSLEAYSSAGAIAKETLDSIRTVTAFNAQCQESLRYANQLEIARQASELNHLINGIGWGLYNALMLGAFAVCFWFGGKFVAEGKLLPGEVLDTFLQISTGLTAIGDLSGFLGTLNDAKVAAREIFYIVDRKPKIDALSEIGIDDVKILGNIEFQNVSFFYPTRSSMNVLKNLSFEIKSGQFIGIVAKSGIGKSTIFNLLLRLYDPTAGSILLDGTPIHHFNVHYLRSQIGIVSQEPVLFDGTIYDNIALGARDPKSVTLNQVIKAATEADAMEFIQKLPQGFQTRVTNFELSGGQKQRLVIARCLIRDTPILLFDEATSALDTVSERQVQGAITKLSLSHRRTTVVISHRLSTLKEADRIIVLDESGLVESGSYETLMMMRNGIFANLAKTQDLDIGNSTVYVENKRQSDDGSLLKGNSSAPHSSPSIPVFLKVSKQRSIWTFWQALFRFSRPEMYYMATGFISSTIEGMISPMQGYIIASVVAVFSSAKHDIHNGIWYWCYMLMILAMSVFIILLVQNYSWGVVGARLTKRLRSNVFKSILRQDIAFFDHPECTSGFLTSKLASDVAAVESITGGFWANWLKIVISTLAALYVAFTSSWRLAIVMSFGVPLIALGNSLHMRSFSGYTQEASRLYERSSAFAGEALSNIREVAVLGKERWFYMNYHELLLPQDANERRRRIQASIGAGSSDALIILVYAAGLYYSGYLIISELATNSEILRVLVTITFSAINGGHILNQANAAIQGKHAVMSILDLIERVPDIDIASSKGKQPKNVCGAIAVKNISFTYQNRPESKVLDQFSLNAEVDQRIAIVGRTGSGKSTVIALMQRFYDPDAGIISMDKVDLRDWHLEYFRSHIACVSQDGTLFDRSIKENIAFGMSDVSDHEVIEAAKIASAHEFISKLPLGYSTKIGTRGSLLSGGQRQRIAIARACCRMPKVLLLDEATSSLDSESEAAVSQALSAVAKTTTTISVAHRLSSVKDYDQIIVVDNGQVVEAGTHHSLIGQRGLYYQLARDQSLM